MLEEVKRRVLSGRAVHMLQEVAGGCKQKYVNRYY